MADKREEFERLSHERPKSPADEKAFVRQRIELARRDPSMTDAERERVIAELERLLEE